MLTTSSTKIIKKKTGKRILLVDDEPDITMAISIALESSGFEFEVCSFNDPILALSGFRPDYYDLAILDIKMPAMDGFELYDKIKKIDSRVKVCFITATDKTNYEGFGEPEQEREDTSQHQQYYALNKNMFLQKPISNRDLVIEINKRIRD